MARHITETARNPSQTLQESPTIRWRADGWPGRIACSHALFVRHTVLVRNLLRVGEIESLEEHGVRLERLGDGPPAAEGALGTSGQTTRWSVGSAMNPRSKTPADGLHAPRAGRSVASPVHRHGRKHRRWRWERPRQRRPGASSLRDRGLGSQSGCISLAVLRPCSLLGRSPARSSSSASSRAPEARKVASSTRPNSTARMRTSVESAAVGYGRGLRAPPQLLQIPVLAP